MEGQCCQVINRVVCVALIHLQLQPQSDECMQTRAAGGTQFARETFADEIVAEGERVGWTGANHVSLYSFSQVFLHRFDRSISDIGKHRYLEGTTDKGCHAQQFDHLWRESHQSLAQRMDNTRRKRG